ncbi:MAG: hypothetical protein B1H04_04440 [Planctomycetales bacterium 4484_123]|nr:MAG: hypothetical protein B1H04_04440 [Planctomycetales bacterium 4484_123]
MSVAIAKQPLDDASHCGDECRCWRSPGRITLCVIDGLGHGPGAEQAAAAAAESVGRHVQRPLAEIFTLADAELRDTRGVAMGVAVIEPAEAKLTYAGVGNTRAMVVGGRTTVLAGVFGIVGGGYEPLRPQTVTLELDDLVILFTDGLAERIDVSGYDQALLADADQLAWRILADWARADDDAAVLVFRNGENT